MRRTYRRYAEAFLSFASQTIGEQKAVVELTYVKDVIMRHPDMQNFLWSMEISRSEKHGIVDAVFSGGLSKETRTFIRFLVDKGRIANLVGIIEYCQRLFTKSQKMVGCLKVARPVAEDVVARIRKVLEKKFSRPVEIVVRIEPDLIAGARLLLDNIVIDGSVRRRLDELKAKLLSSGWVYK